MHDTKVTQEMGVEIWAAREVLLEGIEVTPLAEPTQAKGKRGRPQRIQPAHLWVSLLWSVLLGMKSYADWWRLFCTQTVGSFAPLTVSVDALTTRLEQGGLEPLQQLAGYYATRLAERLAPLVQTPLAAWAREIVSIDESTLDAVQRWLEPLRNRPKGDAALLAGKIAGRFNLRTQQWDYLQYRSNVWANCKVEVLSLLEGLMPGSLILFDLGYFSFAWFDYLTQMGYCYICRWREKTTYRIIHTNYRHHEILDAVVWLGASKGAHAGHAVRLVRFGDGKQLRLYLTNVLDPAQLSMVDIAQLYARRWDIELAFLTLKELLGLHHWWSSKRLLIVQQVWVVLIIAQLLQAMRLEIAAEAHVDLFDVSLPLLIKSVPHLIRQRQNPIDWVLTHGKHLGFIRKSTRLQVVAPQIAPEHLIPLPAGLQLVRKAHYLEYQPRPGKPSKPKPKTTRLSKEASPTSPPKTPKTGKRLKL